MSKVKYNQTKGIPQWQSEKMKAIITESWEEVLLAIEAREKERNKSKLFI